jgi:hypothetical protein
MKEEIIHYWKTSSFYREHREKFDELIEIVRNSQTSVSLQLSGSERVAVSYPAIISKDEIQRGLEIYSYFFKTGVLGEASFCVRPIPSSSEVLISLIFVRDLNEVLVKLKPEEFEIPYFRLLRVLEQTKVGIERTTTYSFNADGKKTRSHVMSIAWDTVEPPGAVLSIVASTCNMKHLGIRVETDEENRTFRIIRDV